MSPSSDRPLRIAYVCPTIGRPETHASVNAMTAYTLHLLSNIHRTIVPSWTLTILTSHKRNASHAELPKTEILISPPVRIERCFAGNSLGFLNLFLAIRRHGFDLVHVQHETHLYGGPLSILLFPLFVGLTRLITVPVVTLHHVINPDQINRIFAQMHHTRIPPLIIRWGYRIFYRLLGICAPSIIVHDELFKKTLTEQYAIPAENVSVIAHGVEDPTSSTAAEHKQTLARHFRIPEDATTIFGFFGYFTGYKGIEFLLHEFGAHVQKHPHSVLLVGGLPAEAHAEKKSHRSYIDSLQQLAEAVAPGRVIWYGAVHDEDIGRYFRLIDCLVLPYRLCFASSGPLSYAIGSATPFLASEELRPLVPYESLLFPLKDGALQEKLSAFAALSPTEREALVHPLEALKKAHQWETVAASTVQAYQNALRHAAHHTDILLVGAYGQQNTGDELLLDRCLALLPHARCTVASMQPSLTEARHNVFAIDSHKRRFSFLRHFLQSKTIVVGGGDQFKLLKRSMNRARYSLLFQCFLLTLAGRILRKPVYFIGVGIGNISTAFARFLTFRTLRLATAVSFRDRGSYDLCRTSAPRARALLSADLAFTGAPTRGKSGRTLQHRTLGIAPVFAIDHHDQYSRVLRETGRAVDEFLGQDPEQSALFLPFQSGFNTHHDAIVSRDILAHVEQEHRCTIVEPFDIDRVEATYRSLDILWGMRLHSIILACLHAVPFIALIYDVKVKKFLEEIDCADWGIPLDASFSAERLLALQHNLVEHLPDVRDHLRRQAEKLASRAQINARLLKNIATEIGGEAAVDTNLSVHTVALHPNHILSERL